MAKPENAGEKGGGKGRTAERGTGAPGQGKGKGQENGKGQGLNNPNIPAEEEIATEEEAASETTETVGAESPIESDGANTANS